MVAGTGARLTPSGMSAPMVARKTIGAAQQEFHTPDPRLVAPSDASQPIQLHCRAPTIGIAVRGKAKIIPRVANLP
jgi:hypothetical protein